MAPLSRGEPAHYISTLPFLGRDPQDASPLLKKDVERFLWNFLASRTAAGPAAAGSCEEAPGMRMALSRTHKGAEPGHHGATT